MKLFARFAVLVLLLFAATTLIRLAPSLAQGREDDEKPKNLKVLPKDLSHRQVEQIMRGYALALGVRCNECHAQAASGDELDFASDKKDEKLAARKMMKMVASINDQIRQMDFTDSLGVSCVTCHHGLKQPQTLGQVVMKSAHEKGVDAAIANYRQLRDQYYGSGAYDFSPITLNDVANQMAQNDHNYDDALKLVNLNLEFTPKDVGTYLTIGRVNMAKGDKAAAVTAFQKAIELDPNNRFAKMLLQQAQGGQ